jgi:hypothetical protein
VNNRNIDWKEKRIPQTEELVAQIRERARNLFQNRQMHGDLGFLYKHELNGWKAWIVGKFQAFPIQLAIPYVGVKGSGNNPVLSLMYLTNIQTLKMSDTVNMLQHQYIAT